MGNLVLIFGFSSVKTIRITLNFNRERFFFPTSVIYSRPLNEEDFSSSSGQEIARIL